MFNEKKLVSLFDKTVEQIEREIHNTGDEESRRIDALGRLLERLASIALLGVTK
jgi:hypothetical protein